MPNFTLEASDGFKKDYLLKPPEVRVELDNVLRFLRESGPAHNSLNSHKIDDKQAKRLENIQVWESYVTWSRRLTWHYKAGHVIFLRATNGHEILPKR